MSWQQKGVEMTDGAQSPRKPGSAQVVPVDDDTAKPEAPPPYPGPPAAPVEQQQQPPVPVAQPAFKEICAVKVCGWFGIPIYVSLMFPLWIVMDIAWCFTVKSGETALLIGLVLLQDALSYFFLLIHVYAQSAMVKLFKGHTDYISIWPAGGFWKREHPGGRKQEILICLAGPLTHVPWAIIFGFILGAQYGMADLWYYWLPLSDWVGVNILRGLLRTQIVLFCFNLLVPIYPLSGGCILALLLTKCMPLKKVALIMLWLSLPFAFGLAIWGWVSGLAMNFLVALWILLGDFHLWRARKANQLERHPLFECISRERPNPAGAGQV